MGEDEEGGGGDRQVEGATPTTGGIVGKQRHRPGKGCLGSSACPHCEDEGNESEAGESCDKADKGPTTTTGELAAMGGVRCDPTTQTTRFNIIQSEYVSVRAWKMLLGDQQPWKLNSMNESIVVSCVRFPPTNLEIQEHTKNVLCGACANQSWWLITLRSLAKVKSLMFSTTTCKYLYGKSNESQKHLNQFWTKVSEWV